MEIATTTHPPTVRTKSTIFNAVTYVLNPETRTLRRETSADALESSLVRPLLTLIHTLPTLTLTFNFVGFRSLPYGSETLLDIEPTLPNIDVS